MIAPLQPFPIRGVVWYQGESSIRKGMAYAGKMRDLIEGLPASPFQTDNWTGGVGE